MGNDNNSSGFIELLELNLINSRKAHNTVFGIYNKHFKRIIIFC